MKVRDIIRAMKKNERKKFVPVSGAEISIYLIDNRIYIVEAEEPTLDYESNKIPTAYLNLEIEEIPLYHEKKENKKIRTDLDIYSDSSTLCPRVLPDLSVPISGKMIPSFNEHLNKIYKDRETLWMPEIHWICLKGKRTLLPLESITHVIQKIKSKEYRYIIVPLSVHSKDQCIVDESKLEGSSHENILFIDMKKRKVERYDPTGQDLDYDFLQLDQLLLLLFERAVQFQYIAPMDDFPKDGIQCMQKDSNDCVAWCYSWSELRLRYPDMPRSQLFYSFLATLEKEKKKVDTTVLKQYVRRYLSCVLLHTQK